VDRAITLRAGLGQAIAVAVVSIALAVALPHSFFEDWGWLAGPGVWAACAVVCARAFRLPIVTTLVGAALSGLPSLAAVLADVHWAGTPLALILFGLWCGMLATRGRRDPRAVAA